MLPVFDEAVILRLATVLSDAASHQRFSEIFERLGIPAPPRSRGEGLLMQNVSRLNRINDGLLAKQTADRCGNNVGAFVEAVLAPVNFINQGDRLDATREEVNIALAFAGLQVGADGKLRACERATTLSDAEARASRLRVELRRRNVHEDVLRHCRPELVDKNYFHAVLEATKSVAEKIRTKTGLVCDGAELAQRALSGKQPPLAINALATDSERSEQSGFMNLLVGAFGMFRNPTAHAPKLTWAISEDEALEALTLLSLLHRRLDRAFLTGFPVSK